MDNVKVQPGFYKAGKHRTSLPQVGVQNSFLSSFTNFDIHVNNQHTERHLKTPNEPAESFSKAPSHNSNVLSTPLCADNWHEKSNSDNALPNVLGVHCKRTCFYVKRKKKCKKKVIYQQKWVSNCPSNVSKLQSATLSKKLRSQESVCNVRTRPKSKPCEIRESRKEESAKRAIINYETDISCCLLPQQEQKLSDSNTHVIAVKKDPFKRELSLIRAILEREKYLGNLLSIVKSKSVSNVTQRQLNSLLSSLQNLAHQVITLAVSLKAEDISEEFIVHEKGTEKEKCKLIHTFTHAHSHVRINFNWEGKNYLSKMLNDLDFCQTFLAEIRRIDEFKLVQTMINNPLLLPCNLEMLEIMVVNNTDCPEGELWKYFGTLNATEYQQQFYYAALVAVREKNCSLSEANDNFNKPDQNQQSIRVLRNATMKHCIYNCKREQAPKPSCWYSQKCLLESGYKESSHFERIPFSPFLKQKIGHLFKKSWHLQRKELDSNETFAKMAISAKKIQRFGRRILKLKVRQGHVAATKIQGCFRAKRCRNAYKEMMEQEEDKQKEEAVKLWLFNAESAALMFQCAWRQYCAHTRFLFLLKTNRATKIQAWFRCVRGKYDLKVYFRARLIQTTFRVSNAKSELKRRRHALNEKIGAMNFQRLFRGMRGRKKFHEYKVYCAATRIETTLRRYLAVESYHKQQRALRIQCSWRVHRAKNMTMSLRRRRSAARHIQRFSRWFMFSKRAELSERWFQWKVANRNNGLFQNQRLQKQLRVKLFHTVSAKERLSHLYKFIDRAEESQGKVKLLAVTKLKDYYAKFLIFTKHYSLVVLIQKIEECTSQIAIIQRKLEFLQKVVEERVAIEISREKIDAILNTKGDSLPVSRDYLIKRLQQLNFRLEMMKQRESLASKSCHWPQLKIVNDWKKMQKKEAKWRRRQEAKSCSNSIRHYINSTGVRRAIKKREEKNHNIIMRKKLLPIWESMKYEDNRSTVIRGFLSAPAADIEEAKHIFKSFNHGSTKALNKYDFQLLAYQLGSLLQLVHVRNIMENTISAPNKTQMNCDDFVMWWLCDKDNHHPNIGKASKRIALKLKLQMMHNKRFVKQLIQAKLEGRNREHVKPKT